VSDGVGFYNSNEIYAMGSPNFTVLRRKLDNLQAASSETVYAPRLEVILLQAADDLQQLNFNHSIDVLTAQREIILIAPHSIDISNQIPELEGIRLNLITSGIIPLRVSPHVTGWCLNTVYPVPSFSRHGQDEKDMHANDLAALISTARFASHPGTISNLFVDIIPGPETVVEKIIGAKSLTKLLPGQSTSLLLKLRVKSVDEIIRNRNPEFFGPTDNVASLEDAFTDLEVILGELLRELVTVTISYKHSNFPDNTDLTVKEKCWIRRTSALQIKRKGQGSGIEREMVQKALALALASRSKPQSGLRGLQRVFDDPTFTNTIPLLVALLKDELEFQANALFERNFIQNLHRQHMATYMPAFDRVRSSLELNTSHTHQRAYAALASPVHHSSSASVHRHQPSNEYADAVQNTEATGPVRFYAAQNKSANEFPSSASVQSTETTGPLRFWRNLRQVSKGKVTANSELAGKDDSFEEEGLTEKMAQIRKEALKNKRSIGTDTLRSMARSLGRGGESSSVKVSRIAEEAVEEKSSSSST
jgi:hypothetical protein